VESGGGEEEEENHGAGEKGEGGRLLSFISFPELRKWSLL
jgi:hypothetical protein